MGVQLAPQACALRLDTELGRLATSASVRHSVWKRRVRSFSLADRVGVALERCPGFPSWRLARTSSRESGLWLAPRLRIRKTRPITRRASMVEGGSTGRRPAALRRASDSGFLESELHAGEAGVRAATAREAYRSTRLVGAGRAGPSRSASDAVGEQPGLESGGLHRVPSASLVLITDARCERGLAAKGWSILVVFLFLLISY